MNCLKFLISLKLIIFDLTLFFFLVKISILSNAIFLFHKVVGKVFFFINNFALIP